MLVLAMASSVTPTISVTSVPPVVWNLIVDALASNFAQYSVISDGNVAGSSVTALPVSCALVNQPTNE